MKKTILITLLSTLVLCVNSQITHKVVKDAPRTDIGQIDETTNTNQFMGGTVALWSEDFSDNTIPNVVTQDNSGYGDWKWSTSSPGGQWTAAAQIMIESETPDNGFMLMEADFYNTGPQNGLPEDGTVGENAINAYFTIGPIDLSASETTELVLQFYSDYRICCFPSSNGSNDLNVYVSTDGQSFQDLDYIEGDTYETNNRTSVLSQIPLGNYAANTNGVYFRFEWIGTHYYWMIDDISVIARPAYDLQMKSSWLTMEDPANIEYYSIPVNQMPDQMLIGAEVYNYGYNDEDSISLDGSIDNQNIYGTINEVEVLSDSTGYIETAFFDISNLPSGIYNFTAQVNSGGIDSNPDDNSLSRQFEISENKYAIGGLYSSSDYTGTGWPGGDDTSDGLKFANYFDIKESTVLSSILVDFANESFSTSLGTFQTVSGGEMIAYVCDTTGIFDPTVETLAANLGGEIWTSDFYLITDQDVINGYSIIDVDELTLDPGAYYIVIEMYSNGLENDIIIRDDTSVPQPWWASLMFYPSDQTWYSDPNAAGIELGLNGNETSVAEDKLTSINFFPNPADDYMEITSNSILNGQTSINIYSITGNLIDVYNFSNFGYKREINTGHLTSGSYIMEFKNHQTVINQKLIIE